MSEHPSAPSGRELYQDLHRELLAFLTRRLRCRHAAADATQESYARVLTAQRRGLAVADFRALLYTAARNLVVDAARHRRVEEGWAGERAALPGGFAPSTEFVAAQRQVVERVAAVLEALPARRRDVFLMFRVHGHTRQEIAQALRITEAAVAKHVVRATLDCAAVLAQARSAMPETECLPAAESRPAAPPMAWQA